MSDRYSMIARLLALGAVMLVSSGSQMSCTTGDTERLDDEDDEEELRSDDLGSGNGATFSTTLVLKDSAGNPKSTFERGELIFLELTVRNRTDQPQTVSLSSPNATDFFVFRDNDDDALWNASHGTASATVITPLPFLANETKVLTISWNQEVPGGTFLQRGAYDARAAVMVVGVFGPSGDLLNPHELASNLREFTVN